MCRVQIAPTQTAYTPEPMIIIVACADWTYLGSGQAPHNIIKSLRRENRGTNHVCGDISSITYLSYADLDMGDSANSMHGIALLYLAAYQPL